MPTWWPWEESTQSESNFPRSKIECNNCKIIHPAYNHASLVSRVTLFRTLESTSQLSVLRVFLMKRERVHSEKRDCHTLRVLRCAKFVLFRFLFSCRAFSLVEYVANWVNNYYRFHVNQPSFTINVNSPPRIKDWATSPPFGLRTNE